MWGRKICGEGNYNKIFIPINAMTNLYTVIYSGKNSNPQCPQHSNVGDRWYKIQIKSNDFKKIKKLSNLN